MAVKNLFATVLPLVALFAIEAARAAAPHTRETAYAYFQDEAEEAIARATERVWDPSLRACRVAGDTLLCEATITDPTTWVGPWSIEVPWPMLDPPGMCEFACHEQNYGIINVVRGAQM
jgi:hypothetical protein